MGTNIPGKARQALNYSAGVPQYKATIWDVYNNDLKGFDLDNRSNEKQSKHGITEIQQAKHQVEVEGAAPR